MHIKTGGTAVEVNQICASNAERLIQVGVLRGIPRKLRLVMAEMRNLCEIFENVCVFYIRSNRVSPAERDKTSIIVELDQLK